MEQTARSPLVAAMIRRAQQGEYDEFFKNADNQRKIVASLRDASRLNESLKEARRIEQDFLMRHTSI